MTNQQDELKTLLKDYKMHRVGSHSDDYGGDSDKPCFCDLYDRVQTLINKAVQEALEKVEQAGPKDINLRLPETDEVFYKSQANRMVNDNNITWRAALAKIKEEYGGKHDGSETS